MTGLLIPSTPRTDDAPLECAIYVLAVQRTCDTVRNAMPYNPDLHHRRSIRLPAWDYRERGAYFVTICTHERECLFEDGALRAAIEETWHAILRRSRDVVADEFVAMPNHVHGIIWIARPQPVRAQHPAEPVTPRVGAQHPPRPVIRLAKDDISHSGPLTARVGAAPLHPAPLPAQRVLPRSLGAIVRSFKSNTTRRINNIRRAPGAPVWQRNYYEHVVRDEADLARIRQYIRENPAKWVDDPDNPVNNR